MKFISICNIGFLTLFIISMTFLMYSIVFLLFDYVVFIEWELLTLNSSSIVMTFLFDWMSLMFMSFVLFISSLVIYYSKEYMHGDNNLNRFILLVLMFVLSMMLLIISPNLISILLGWDGLGLVSYLLVIYFQNVKSYNAGMLTALSNRVGDVALLLAIAWMLNYGSWNYIFFIEFMKNSLEMKIIMVMIIIAGMTKSAQIPFSSWLPAAMAAPTPVSALVHSSTLVTAGVYLLIRFSVLLESQMMLSKILLLLGSLTMFMAGMGANYEFDLKKIIALSTLSQLGLMISILSMGFYKLAFFHLLTHALFKALLFMCAGAIIHNMGSSQDIRMMGGMAIQMPLTSTCFNIANLALCGMPFLAGFYSKDLILEIVSFSNVNMFIFFLYFFSTGLTVCYSFRLVFFSMTGDFNSLSLNVLNDEGWIMLKGMFGLLFMSIIGGAVLSWLIFPTPEVIYLPAELKMLTPIVCVLGGLIGYLISDMKIYYINKSLLMYNISNFLGLMWFMPFISTYGVISYPLNLGSMVIKGFDQGWSEFLGGQYMYMMLTKYSSVSQVAQNNSLKIYLLIFLLGVMMLFMMLILL